MPQLNHQIRNAMLAFLADFDGAGLAFYTGTAPDPNDAPTGTLVGNATMGSPAFNSPVDGLATANPITPGSALLDATIGYARIEGGSSTAQFTVSNVGGGGEVQFANVSVKLGEPLIALSFTWFQPAS